MINKKKDYWNMEPLRYKTWNIHTDFMLALQRVQWVRMDGEPMPEWYHRSWRNYVVANNRYSIFKIKRINKHK